MDPVEKLLESKLQVAESEMSHTAIEYLTSVVAEFYLHGIITNRKYPPQFHSRLFAVLMKMLLDINEYDDEEGASFRLGKECLVRLANHLGGDIIFPAASDQFSEYLAVPDTEWRKHHAALVALAQISQGCSKVMIRNSQQLVTMVLNSFHHPHPRVRWAALTAIVHLSHDLNLQPRYYTRMLPALASAMDDPKLQEHAASAVRNFIKNYCTPDILTPYRDEIVSKLSVLLQSSNTRVQEAALTALASVADNSSQEQFQKYCDEVMPYLKAILDIKNDKASRMLRVYAKRCINHFAVGKDKFRDDPKQVPGEKVIKAGKGYNLEKRKCQLSEPGPRPKKIAPSKCEYLVPKSVSMSVLISPRINPNYTKHTHTHTSSLDPAEKLLESKLQVAESELSHTAIEYLTSVAAEFYLHGIITNRKYPPLFHSRLFAVLMRMLLDINEYDDEEGASFRLGKECLVRLANHLGGDIIFPAASDQFSEYLAAPDTEWRKHHAALVALAQISQGCSKVMIKNSQQLVTMVLTSFRHPHPRVRWAALTAIVRLSHDLNLQPRYYTRMLPALASAMHDPKLQEHAASAVINFIKNYCTPDILTPYRDEIVSKLSVLLQSSNTRVQEAALTALASVADNSSQEQFQKYCDEVMPYLKAILVSKNEKANRMLQFYAKRCIDHFAVGKDKFRDDPKQVPGEKVIKAGQRLQFRKKEVSAI